METQTMRQFIESNNIRAKIEWADSNPNLPNDPSMPHHWRVTLKYGRRQLTTPFSGGADITHIDSADVLNSLALDAAGIENARDFNEWCAEYGYDDDSRTAECIYRLCGKSAAHLRRFLGPDLYEQLLWRTDPL